MKTPRVNVWIAALLALAALPLAAAENGGFEDGLAGWKRFWTRLPDAGTCTIDKEVFHSGGQSARLEHRGQQDWSFEPVERLSVQQGDLFELDVWVKLQGAGTVTLCAATLDSSGRTIAWSFGERTAHERRDWFRLHSRFVVPPGVAIVQPRLIGQGPATIWVDDFSVARLGNVAARQAADLPAALSLTNSVLAVKVMTSDATLSVQDRRTGRQWSQTPMTSDVVVTGARHSQGEIRLELLHTSSALQFIARVMLEAERPELLVELIGSGELPAPIRFPHPFTGQQGDYLVIPMNEGISYPVEDGSIEPMRLIAYGGHGICMAFWGVTDGAAGHMALIESPDDAAIRIDRAEGKLAVTPEWESQKGQFGYARRLRYVFFSTGGHVAMCKRYRAHAQELGLVKTLSEKRTAKSSIDLLVGAVNVWCWDRDPLPLVREMQAMGIERILWSNRQSPEGVRAMNELGILTSRYDIYQDVMNPENFPKLRSVHPDWTTEAWPGDLMIGPGGEWIRGWAVKGKDDHWYPCGVVCDRPAPEYARRRIPLELATHPYRSRFIDTTTASPWRECYAPEHPLTRGESRRWKMELLRYVSEENQLVTGCETGHDAAVPFVDYFEGMLSLGPYRVPDSGRDMQRIWTEVPERVETFQLGHRYRLPLWELVFHDCVVSQWYWGDYNNKLPALWDKRDLFNLLYGTPPMFMFNRELWDRNKQRFLQSYQTICPAVRAVGYAEMVDHQFLTPNRDVQQTRFANGTAITVNFGSQPFELDNGVVIRAMGSHVQP